MLWDQPANTITTSIMGKATCQLHPGLLESEECSLMKPLLNALPKLPDSGLTTSEFFAGGGLMRLGLEHAGIRTVYAADWDKRACRAHEFNFGEGSIECVDITQKDIDALPDSDIASGGPPCQDYSVAGTGAGEEGDRGKLVWTYLEIIKRKQYKAFIFENVKGLIQKKHRGTFEALLERFDSIGYNVTWKLINAWDYGVAQKRERVFIVGIRKDLGFAYRFPQGEWETTGYHPVLRDAIGDLPEPSPNHAPEKKMPAYIQTPRVTDWDEPSPTIITHIAKDGKGFIHPDTDYEFGRKATDEVAASTENHDGHLFDNVGNNPTWDHTNRVAPWDKPAPTRTEKDRCDGIHPGTDIKPRRFTVRECLRIQSVPDSYIFPEDMSLSSMYMVVGNGVASRVAYHLGKALVEQLIERSKKC